MRRVRARDGNGGTGIEEIGGTAMMHHWREREGMIFARTR